MASVFEGAGLVRTSMPSQAGVHGAHPRVVEQSSPQVPTVQITRYLSIIMTESSEMVVSLNALFGEEGRDISSIGLAISCCVGLGTAPTGGS